MTDIHSSRPSARKRGRSIVYILVVLSLIIVPVLLFRSCDISPEAANLALIIDGKTYLHSVSAGEDMKESCPPDHIMIYIDGDAFFIDPSQAQTIVDAMAGNVDLFDYQEVSYEGYFNGSAKDTFITRHSEYKSTATIGEQILKESATIRNRSNETMEIKWNFDQKNGEYNAEKNCEVHAFWSQTTVSPGETAYATEDHLVISLAKLAEFYGCTLSYDQDKQVLFITLK